MEQILSWGAQHGPWAAMAAVLGMLLYRQMQQAEERQAALIAEMMRTMKENASAMAALTEAIRVIPELIRDLIGQQVRRGGD